jgi:hypothetical protein
MAYAALPAVSDLAIASDAAAAQAMGAAAGGGGARRASILGSVLSAMNAAVAGQKGTTASAASQGSLLAVSPRARLSEDLLPGRAMDSRTVTLSALLPTSSTATLTLPTPIQLVIPLRDLSLVSWDAATQSAMA